MELSGRTLKLYSDLAWYSGVPLRAVGRYRARSNRNIVEDLRKGCGRMKLRNYFLGLIPENPTAGNAVALRNLEGDSG